MTLSPENAMEPTRVIPVEGFGSNFIMRMRMRMRVNTREKERQRE